jgi:ABC-2 type transport system permease protein
VIAAEFTKQLRRPRTWLAYGCLVVLPIIATIAAKLNPPRNELDSPEVLIYRIATKSGINQAIAALAFTTPFFLVLVIAAFAGDTVAGEANWGTLRYLLVRPIGRLKLLYSKAFVATTLTFLAVVVVVATALVAGTIAFGWHPVATVFSDIPQALAMGRLGMSIVYVTLCLFTMISFGLLVSVMTDTSIGAMGGVVGVNIVSQILDAIPNIGSIRYGLPTHYWTAWTSLFVPGTGYVRSDMTRGLVISAVYSAVFLGTASWWFRRKDVLS